MANNDEDDVMEELAGVARKAGGLKLRLKSFLILLVAVVLTFAVTAGYFYFKGAAKGADAQIAKTEAEEARNVDTSAVFGQIKNRGELVCASQDYCIIKKRTDVSTFFNTQVEIPGTHNYFWYQYSGTIKVGVDLSTAELVSSDDSGCVIALDQPYIVSNDVNMKKTGTIEEGAEIFNPIDASDVDEAQREFEKQSEAEAAESDIFDIAKDNALGDLQTIFGAVMGDSYIVSIQWR